MDKQKIIRSDFLVMPYSNFYFLNFWMSDIDTRKHPSI